MTIRNESPPSDNEANEGIDLATVDQADREELARADSTKSGVA